MRLIAAGGFGAVWRAQQKALDRPVAVKTLHAELADTPEAVQRFESEARLTASIHHESVVTLLDHGVEDRIPWMAFEFIDGPSLRSWVERGPQPWRRVAEMARQVALALEEARRCGVVHRDVKPDNILQAGDAHFKVADFGVAKWAGASVKTQEGVILGTPAYISPVQVRGLAPDHQSDLYALGVTMFELLTGRLPFEHENPIVLLERHVHQPPPRPSTLVEDLPPALERIVLKLLAKEREERFGNAHELADALAAVLQPPAKAARTVAAAAPDGRPFREWAMPLAALAVVVAIVGGRLTRGPAPVVAIPVASGSVTKAVDPTRVEDLHHELLRLQSEANRMSKQSPRNEDSLLGFEAIEADLARVRRAVDEYRQALDQVVTLSGAGTEPLLQAERTGWDLLSTVETYMDFARLGPARSAARAELPHLDTALRQLARSVSEARATPLGVVLFTTLGPQLAGLTQRKSRNMEIVPPTAARASLQVEALFEGSTAAGVILARLELIERAVHNWLARRRRDESSWTENVGPSSPEEREARASALALVPTALALKVSDPLLRGHMIRLHQQLASSVGYLAADPLAVADQRRAACRALQDVLVAVRRMNTPYDSLRGLVSLAMLLAEVSRKLGVPLDSSLMREVTEYFNSAGAVKHPWPLHIEKKVARDPR